jgi:DNA-binding MarR family transcriptional regulator
MPLDSIGLSILALAVFAIAAAVLLAVFSARYRRDRHMFMESKDVVSGIVRVFTGRLQKHDESLDALKETVHRVLKTQEEQQAGLERITEHTAQSMDLERRLIGALGRLVGKVNQAISGAAIREKAEPSERLVVDEYLASIETALSRLTPTELKVLQLLAVEGPLGSPNIGRTIGKSREHTARLMKRLYEQGYVDRETSKIPYRYKLTEKVRGALEKREEDKAKQKVEEQAQEKRIA